MAKNQTFNLSIKLLTQQFQKGLNTVQKQLRTFGNYIKSVFAVTGITSFIRQLTNVGGAFESQMARVRAVANATDAEYKMLEETAKRIGKNTRYSAMEAAEGLEILTRNGLSTAQAAEVLTPALDLAAANAIGLAEAGDMVTNVLNMFNKQTSEAGAVADILSTSCANSATDVTNLYEAFKNAGPTAASLGLSIEETAGALMTLANQGIKGADAGSKLSQIFSKMVLPKVQDKFMKLGIEINSDTLKMYGLRDAIMKLRDAELSPEEMATLFGEKSWKSVEMLVKEFDALKENVDIAGNASGTASRMAEQGIGSWELATKELKNTWNASMQKMFEAMKPILIGVVNMVKGIIQWITSLPGVVAAALSIISVTVIKAIGKVKTAQDNATNSTRVLTQAYEILEKALASKNFAAARIELEKLIQTEAAAGRQTNQLTAAYRALAAAETQVATKGVVSAATITSVSTQSKRLQAEAIRTGAALTKTSVAAGVFSKALNGLKLAGKGVLQFFGGWVGLAITAATILGSVLVNSIKKSRDAMYSYDKIHKEAVKTTGAEVEEIRAYKKVLDNSNNSLDTKQRAINKLTQLIPGYRAEINKATGEVRELTTSVDEYCKSLVRQVELQKLAEKRAELVEQQKEAEAALTEHETKLEAGEISLKNKAIALFVRHKGVTIGLANAHKLEAAEVEQETKAYNELGDQIAEVDAEMQRIAEDEVKKSNSGVNIGGGGKPGADDDARTKAAKKYQKAIENLDAVRKKSEEDYKNALAAGKSEEEARLYETLSYEDYLKEIISATEQYIQTISELNDLQEEDLKLISKLTAGLVEQRKAYKAIQDAKKEAIEDDKEYIKNLESLEKAVKSAEKSEKKQALEKQSRSKWDYFSTDPKEYKQLIVDITRAEEDLSAAENELSRFSDEEISKVRERIAYLKKLQAEGKLTKEQEEELARSEKVLAHYDKAKEKIETLRTSVTALRNDYEKFKAEDAIAALKKEQFDTAYSGVKTLISGAEQLKSAFERIGEGGADMFDYIDVITSTIDTIMSLIETVKTMQQLIEGLKIAEDVYAKASILNSGQVAVAEEAKAAAIETSEAGLAAEVTASEVEKTAAVVGASQARAAAYQVEMAAAATAANAWAGLYGVALAASEIAGMEALIQSAATLAAIPKFASGGILGGSSRTGDKLLFRGNSGEVILNDRQQKNLLDIANGKGKSGNSGKVEFFISGKNLKGVLNNINSSSSKIKGNL